MVLQNPLRILYIIILYVLSSVSSFPGVLCKFPPSSNVSYFIGPLARFTCVSKHYYCELWFAWKYGFSLL